MLFMPIVPRCPNGFLFRAVEVDMNPMIILFAHPVEVPWISQLISV